MGIKVGQANNPQQCENMLADTSPPGCPCNASGSTFVRAELGTADSSAVNCRGGRQKLRFHNGYLDLSWHFNSKFDSSIRSKSTYFDPAGTGATFGFLAWNHYWAVAGSELHYLVKENHEGMVFARAFGDNPVDPRDPDRYFTSTLRSRFHYPNNTYYFYDNYYSVGTPRYVLRRIRRDGQCAYYTYDPTYYRLLSVSGDTGRLTAYFDYNTAFNIAAVHLQDRSGQDHRTTYYYYKTNNTLSHIVEPENIVTYFNIDNALILSNSEVDPEGYLTYLAYDSSKGYLLKSMVHHTRVTYFKAFQGSFYEASSEVQMGASRVFRRTYVGSDSYNINSQGLINTNAYFEYNATTSLPQKLMDSNGNIREQAFTSRRVLDRKLQPDGSYTYFRYAPNQYDVIAQTGPRNSNQLYQVTYYGYLPGNNGILSQKMGADNAVTYYGYDTRNRLNRTMFPNGGTEYYYFDEFDQKYCIIDADGSVSYFAYNANLQPTQKINALRQATYHVYDKMDQILSTHSSSGEVQYFSYSKRGLLERETWAGGRFAYYAYDAFKNRIRSARETSSGLAVQYFEFDAMDNPVAQADTLARRTEVLFDWNHRVAATRDPANTTTYFWYDSNGNTRFAGGPNDFWTDSKYDGRDRLVSSTRGIVGPRAPAQGTSYFAHWSMDETTGTRFDSTLNNNLLYAKNGATYGPGLIGNAGKLVAANQTYFSVDNTQFNRLSITGDITLAAWFKCDSSLDDTLFTTGQQVILSKYEAGVGGYSLALEYPDKITALIHTVSGQVTAQISGLWSFRNWTHICVTRNAATGEIWVYVNGWQVSRFARTAGNIATTSKPFFIGARIWGGFGWNHFFDGLIDNVYVFDKVLNYDQIGQLASSRISPTYAVENSNLPTSYFGYDFDSNLTQQLNERGFASYFGYDAVNRLVASQDALSNATYHRYDLMSNRTATLNSRGAVTYFGYDLVNRLVRSTDALNQASYFGYDALGNLLQQVTPGSTSAYFAYDSSNRVAAVADALLFTTYYAYDLVGNRTVVQTPRGNTTYFAFNLLNQNNATLDASGQPAYFNFDTEGNLRVSFDHIQGASGAATYFDYDGVNRLVASQDALGRVSYFGYDQAGNKLREALPGERNSYYAYDRLNHLVAQQSPTGNTTYYSYDPTDNRTALLNPRGFASYFGYDAINRLDRSLDAANAYAYFGYDAVGNLIRSQDVRGFASYFTYDLLDRTIETVDAMSGVTQRAYDPAGNVHAVLPPTGSAVYFAYDARKLLTASVDGMGDVSYFGYDANQNRVQTLSPRGYGSYFAYDVLDRLAGLLDAEGGTSYFGYDAGGNVQRVRDALGRDTYFNYDLLDRPKSVQDALQQSVYFGYDLGGNRALELDARGNTTYYNYDLDNRLRAILDPLGSAAYYAYDANSNLALTLDNNAVSTYFGYDVLDRRTIIQYPQENQYFAYDASGNLTTVQDSWGNSYFAYDGLSRTVARSTPRGDAVYYAYDAASNLRVWQYPQEGAACYYGYDGAQRMVQLLSPRGNAVYYAYDASSNVARKALGNGVVSWADFDRAERFNSIRYTQPNGAAIAYFDFGRDISGRIVRIERETDLVQYYEYDPLDRLTAEVWRKKSDSSQIYAFTYEYDPTGNRLRMRRETQVNVEWDSTYYSYAADNSLQQRQVCVPPASISDTYFHYDENGALVRQIENSNTTYFEYGPNQLITKVTPPIADGQPWQFYYDGRLNRYKIDRGGVTRYLLWDGLNCMEERNNDGTLHARYTYGYTRIYGIGSCVEIFMPGTPDKTYTLLMDHRGTAYTLLDESRNEVGTRYYDAFGVILGQSGSWPTDLAYQTNWQTIQIGSKWWGLSAARMYDFAAGVFLQRDLLSSSSLILLPRSNFQSTSGIFWKTVFFSQSHQSKRKLNTYKYCVPLGTCVDPVGLDEAPLADLFKTIKDLLDDFDPKGKSGGLNFVKNYLRRLGFDPDNPDTLKKQFLHGCGDESCGYIFGKKFKCACGESIVQQVEKVDEYEPDDLYAKQGGTPFQTRIDQFLEAFFIEAGVSTRDIHRGDFEKYNRLFDRFARVCRTTVLQYCCGTVNGKSVTKEEVHVSYPGKASDHKVVCKGPKAKAVFKFCYNRDGTTSFDKNEFNLPN